MIDEFGLLMWWIVEFDKPSYLLGVFTGLLISLILGLILYVKEKQ
jgi:hypothetical protein